MDLGLSGKTALVLGAGGGLGGAIAMALAREGAKIAVSDIDGTAIAATRQQLDSIGAASTGIVWDLSDISAIDTHVSSVEGQLGPVDILINNTGGPPPSPAAGQNPDLWLKQFQAMILPVIGLTDRVLPGMRSRKWGRIITSTSSGIVTPIPNLALSNSLRLSLAGWSKTLASEVGRDGVTVNVILPGRIATQRIQFLDEAKAKRENRPVADIVAQSTSSIPAGRYGKPEEYADTVAFLASERASYITGSVIRVDGGLIPSI
jgi:3-oxoacyl-[acyl-carrier protein] reductase